MNVDIPDDKIRGIVIEFLTSASKDECAAIFQEVNQFHADRDQELKRAKDWDRESKLFRAMVSELTPSEKKILTYLEQASKTMDRYLSDHIREEYPDLSKDHIRKVVRSLKLKGKLIEKDKLIYPHVA